MIYTKALEALDRTWGRTVTIADYARLGEKADADLTADDLTIIEAFGGEKAMQDARTRRNKALFPPPAPEPTKKAAPRKPMMGALSQEAVATAIAKTIKASGERANARIADLEARLSALLANKATLHDRVLEAAVERSKSVTHTEALETRVKSLEELVANRLGGLTVVAVDSKPTLRFCGVFRADSRYEPGDAVSHQGGLWICKASPAGKPSEDFSGWQLAVKRGAA